MVSRTTPTYKGLAPASKRASTAARASSKKAGTRCEVLLEASLKKRGLRFRRCDDALPGRPDFVFQSKRVAVFCDGDFWHGRNLADRVKKLAKGHNAPYWVEKIQGNAKRDRRNSRALRKDGWLVLRFWESEILAKSESIASKISRALAKRRPQQKRIL